MRSVGKILFLGIGGDVKRPDVEQLRDIPSIYHDVLRPKDKKDNIERKIGKRSPVLSHLFGKEFSDLGHFRRGAINISLRFHMLILCLPLLILNRGDNCKNCYTAAALYGVAAILMVVFTPLHLLAWAVDILLVAIELPLHPIGYVIDSIWGGVQRLQAGNHEATVEANQDALNPS